jgi:hypothetical protein
VVRGFVRVKAARQALRGREEVEADAWVDLRNRIGAGRGRLTVHGEYRRTSEVVRRVVIAVLSFARIISGMGSTTIRT